MGARMDQVDEYASDEIIVLDSVGSTNEELLARARKGAPHGCALRARIQTAGRGRRDHQWASPGGGLYLSILLRPTVAAIQLPGIPVACGLGVVHSLQSNGCTDISLKWPNDVITPAGKLGGILVEAAQTPTGMAAVCGIGINFDLPHPGARTAGALPITCLPEALAPNSELPAVDDIARSVRDSVLSVFDSWTQGLAGEGPQAPPLFGILDDYNRLLAYNGNRVKVFSPQGAAIGEGTLRGIDLWGRAIVEDEGGRTLELDATHASLRPFTCD